MEIKKIEIIKQTVWATICNEQSCCMGHIFNVMYGTCWHNENTNFMHCPSSNFT